MYLITYGQFNDVVRQENGRKIPGRVVVPSFDSFLDADHWEIEGYDRYGGIIKIGVRHGHPILSFTAGHEKHVVGVPSEAYVKTIISGLKETYLCMRNRKFLPISVLPRESVERSPAIGSAVGYWAVVPPAETGRVT